MVKVFKNFTVIMLLLALLAGCGANSDATTGTTGTTNESKPPLNYPEKEITFIVPTSPGGGFDIASRIIAPYVEKYLPNDVKVVIMNKPGSDWQLGINEVITAKPDGYTIGIFNIPGNTLNQVLGLADYDLTKIDWIARLNEIQFVALAGNKANITSLEDLKNNNDLRSSVGGLSSTSAIGTLVASQEMGFGIKLITEKGSTEAVLATVRGDSDFLQIQYEAVSSYIESGDLIPLWTNTNERMKELPNVPTVGEVGYPELVSLANGHRVIGTTPGTPKEIIEILEKAFLDAMNDPEFIKEMETAKSPVNPLGAEETKQVVIDNIQTFDTYKDVLQQTKQ